MLSSEGPVLVHVFKKSLDLYDVIHDNYIQRFAEACVEDSLKPSSLGLQ